MLAKLLTRSYRNCAEDLSAFNFVLGEGLDPNNIWSNLGIQGTPKYTLLKDEEFGPLFEVNSDGKPR